MLLNEREQKGAKMAEATYTYARDPERRSRIEEILSLAKSLTEQHPDHVIVFACAEERGRDHNFVKSILEQSGVEVKVGELIH